MQWIVHVSKFLQLQPINATIGQMDGPINKRTERHCNKQGRIYGYQSLGWAGAIFEVTKPFGQEPLGQRKS